MLALRLSFETLLKSNRQDHIIENSKGQLANEIDSWLTGVNHNVKGKTKRVPVRYPGPGPLYRQTVNDVADRNWEDMELHRQ